jgi:hypothetical protein
MPERAEIDEVVADVRVYDDEALLSPQLIAAVAARVLPLVEEQRLHRERLHEERCLGPEARP